MRLPVVVYYIGFVLALVGLMMALSAAVSLLYADGSADSLFVAGLLVICVGVFPMVFVPFPKKISPREAMLVVAGAWTASIFAGAAPFYLHGLPFTPVNALFESFSGFTTTGASILIDIEALPKGLLFWRSMTNWIGGVGIIVFALAILPTLGQVSHSLFRSEYSNLTGPQTSPRAKQVARAIVTLYVALTAVETILLMLAGVNLYEASTTSFATIATGGFSVHNASIAAYNSLTVEIIVMAFMVISGLNFAFIYILIVGRKSKRPGWETARLYLALLAGGVLIATWSIYRHNFASLGESLRYASFQICSLGTSTGFATTDSSVWTPPAQLLLVLASLWCACAGSTSGGIKIDRILLLGKLLRLRFRQLIHPALVLKVEVDDRNIPTELAYVATLFIAIYLGVVGASTLALTLCGEPLLESFTGSVACMGNVGPGLGAVGSTGNYSGLTNSSKLILSAVMLIGRLEIFGLLVPFLREFWRK